MSVALARTLTREEVSRLAGVTPEVVKFWTSGDRTIPPEFYFEDGGQGNYRYFPAVVALFELAADLGKIAGVKSPLVKRVVRAVAPEIMRAWDDPRPRRLWIVCDDFEVRIANDAIERARAKVAALSEISQREL